VVVFDEIKTRFGVLPIVADVVDVPGDHSVKTGRARKASLKEKIDAAIGGRSGGGRCGDGRCKRREGQEREEAVTKAAESALAAYLMESGAGTRLFCQRDRSWNWSWSGVVSRKGVGLH